MQANENENKPNTVNIPELSAENVSEFLRKTPHFFEKNASLLAELFLPSPHGSGTISLAERQQLAQRDKIRVLEVKLADLIEFAEENDATSKKVHEYSLKLIANYSFSGAVELTKETLQKDFDVTETIIRIWLRPARNDLLQDEAFTTVSDAFSDWVLTLNAPYCGAKPALSDTILDDNLKSFAIIPLHKKVTETTALQPAFGVLILGSDQPQRFTTNMGTMYLERMGELLSAEILNHI
ncbi:MAG TPA: DUF484 family protein [Methylotenera sp.]|nr:DUF484 family protein [Methylotenera sp.]